MYCLGAAVAPAAVVFCLEKSVPLPLLMLSNGFFLLTLYLGFWRWESPKAPEQDEETAVTGDSSQFSLGLTLCAVYFCIIGGQQGFAFTASVYADRRFSMSAEAASGVSAFLWISVLLGRVATILVARCCTFSAWDVFAASVAACTVFSLIAWPFLAGKTQGLWML